MKKISILGCGWLGLELGKEFAKKNYEVKGSITKSSKTNTLRSSGIDPFILDWNDYAYPEDFFACDIMIITIPPSTSNYVENLSNFMNAVNQHKIKYVVYTSATSVYPDLNRTVIEEDEEVIVSPHSGLALLEVENLVRKTQNVQATIVRFAGLYGPDRIPGKFLAGKKNVSGGNKPVNLVHRDDCVKILIGLIENEIWGETFNACSDYHPTRQQFYHAACLSQNLEPPTFTTEQTNYKIVSSEKLKKALNYQFIHPDPMQDV